MANTLEQRVAEAGFPSGVRIPFVTVVVALGLLAGFCVVSLDGGRTRSTADAIAQSHQWFAAKLARDIGESVNESVGELATTVRLYSARTGETAEQTVDFFAKNSSHANGLAVLDRASGRLLASAGEPVPIESVHAGELTDASAGTVVDRYGNARAVLADVLPGGNRLIIASAALTPPASTIDSLSATVLLGTVTGQLIRPGGGAPVAGELAHQAAAAAAAGQSGHLVGPDGSGPPTASGQHTVALAAYAPVTMGGDQTGLGVSVILLGTTPVAADTTSGGGLLPAITLLGVTLLVVLLLGFVLVRPVRRLRAHALATAAGEKVTHHRYRLREAGPILAAFARSRHQDGTSRSGTGPWSALTATALASVLLLGWSGSVLLTAGRADVHVPDQVVRITQDLAQNTADSLRRSLAQSVTDLESFAALVTNPSASALGPALGELQTRHPRYRSVYVLDAAGATVARVGRTPLRTQHRPPGQAGLHQDNIDGRVPVIFASAPLPDHTHVLVGELDVLKLSALVRKPGGSGRLVDAGMRTLASTDGYRAFEQLDSDPLRTSAESALNGVPAPAMQLVNGSLAVVAAAAITGSPVIDELKWAVVLEQPVSQLPLLGNDIRRGAVLAALIGCVLALLSFGWHLLVVVLPLRRVAAAARKLADGDVRTVVFPQRSDEIGTIAGCLEICRQTMAGDPPAAPSPTKGPLCGSSTRST